jgi:hypothetical protein
MKNKKIGSQHEIGKDLTEMNLEIADEIMDSVTLQKGNKGDFGNYKVRDLIAIGERLQNSKNSEQ